MGLSDDLVSGENKDQLANGAIAQTVFLVQHVHTLPHGEEDVKMIGVYESYTDAMAAARRLSDRPGFADLPEINDGCGDGFSITPYEVGRDHWAEGFVSA